MRLIYISLNCHLGTWGTKLNLSIIIYFVNKSLRSCAICNNIINSINIYCFSFIFIKVNCIWICSIYIYKSHCRINFTRYHIDTAATINIQILLVTNNIKCIITIVSVYFPICRHFNIKYIITITAFSNCSSSLQIYCIISCFTINLTCTT